MNPTNYKAERIKRGLSQAALAAVVGVSRGCINYREAGHDRYPITVEAWLAICSLPQAKRVDHARATTLNCADLREAKKNHENTNRLRRRPKVGTSGLVCDRATCGPHDRERRG